LTLFNIFNIWLGLKPKGPAAEDVLKERICEPINIYTKLK
jgi:hypothetical protein